MGHLRRAKLLLPLAAIALLAASAAPSSAMARTELTLDKSRYGKVLFDGKGRALYLFEKDGTGPSQCYDACAHAWPPFLKRGRLTGGPGVNKKLVGTTQRTDGTTQVTYAGKPLYYYITDRSPGEITCHNVNEFGGLWLVVNRAGAGA